MATESRDPRQPPVNLTVRDFLGMRPNRDPHDIEPGESVHQVNVGPGPAGELRVRLGLAKLVFSSE